MCIFITSKKDVVKDEGVIAHSERVRNRKKPQAIFPSFAKGKLNAKGYAKALPKVTGLPLLPAITPSYLRFPMPKVKATHLKYVHSGKGKRRKTNMLSSKFFESEPKGEKNLKLYLIT